MKKRHEEYLKRADVLEAATLSFQSAKEFASYLCKFSVRDAERVIQAYRKQQEGERRDPIENDPRVADIIKQVDEELAKLFPEKRFGMCHMVWAKKQTLLKKRGVSWISPPELNPLCRFD